MATILTKKSDTASAVPLAADLTNAAGGAELAVNATDKRLFSKTSGGTVVELGTNPTAMAVVGNTTVGGTLGVTGATTLAGVSATTLAASSTVTLSGGTANGVTYLNGSKVVTSGSALTFNGTSLGIGSSSYGDAGTITASIGVAGTTAGGLQLWASSAQEHYIQWGDSTTGSATYAGAISYSHASDFMRFWTNSTEQMRLTSTGLGIGTSSPTRKLDVSGTPSSIGGDGTGVLASIVNTGTAYNASPTSAISLWNKINSSGSTFPSAVLQAGKENATDGNYAGYMSFITIDSGANPNERMRLDSSGNLGLGVTPNAWLSSFRAMQLGQGSSLWGAATGSNAGFDSNVYVNTSGGSIYVGSTFATRYQQNDGTHKWYTAPSGTAGNAITFTQALTLEAGGNLLLGATSISGAGQLRVFNGSTFRATDYYNASPCITAYSAVDTVGGIYLDIQNSAFTRIGSISRGTSTTVLYNVSSDYRLKNITGPITNSGSYIDSLNPVEGTWKEDGTTFVGLIAHEVQEVSRTIVATGTKDGEQMQGMDYSSSEIIANLIAEVKSLRQRVATLEAK